MIIPVYYLYKIIYSLTEMASSPPGNDEVERIHQAVREMQATGSPYTGALDVNAARLGDRDPAQSTSLGGDGGARQRICSLDDLHKTLRARCANPEEWSKKIGELHEELNARAGAMSQEELHHRILHLCPLTPTEASSAARVIELETQTTQHGLLLSPGNSSAGINHTRTQSGSSVGSVHRHSLPSSDTQRATSPASFKRQRPLRLQRLRSVSSGGNSNRSSPRGLARLFEHIPGKDGNAVGKQYTINYLFDPSNIESMSPTSSGMEYRSSDRDRERAIELLGQIYKQKQRRAITEYDLFSYIFGGGKSSQVSLVEFRSGLKRLGIADYGLGDISSVLFQCIDGSGRGQFNMHDLQAALKEYRKRYAQRHNLRSGREEALRKSFDRIANSPTHSSRCWASAKLYSRAFAGAGRDDEKDHDPRKLLAGMARTLKRRTLRDWDIFMACDEDRNGSVTPMEFATGLRKLHFSYTPRQLKRLWEAIDLDHSGHIEFDELRLALSLADKLGEGTKIPEKSGQEESLATEAMEDAMHLLDDSNGREGAGKKAEERAIEQERDRLELQRSQAALSRIPLVRLHALSMRMKSALSAWYNHDRNRYIIRYVEIKSKGQLGRFDDDDAKSVISGETKSRIERAVACLDNSFKLDKHKEIVRAIDDTDGEQSTAEIDAKDAKEGEIASDEGVAHQVTQEPVDITRSRAKQQLRVMVPFTTKELHAFFVQGTLNSSDDSMSLEKFDELLENIHGEILALLRQATRKDRKYSGSASKSPDETRHRMKSMDFTESSSIVEENMTAALPVARVVSRPKPHINVSDLIQKMQHQMLRSMLLNTSLFSAISLRMGTSSRAIRLQLSLLGFTVSLCEAECLLAAFREDAPGLHFALVARKLQKACYTSIDDTVYCAVEAGDLENTGFCPIDHFALIIKEFVSLTDTEARAMGKILAIDPRSNGIPYADVFCKEGSVKVRGQDIAQVSCND